MSDYWKKRFSRIEQRANDKSTEYLQELDGKYRNAVSEIDKQINAWYQRFAKNNEIDMTEARRLLKSTELEELRWDVKEYIKRGRANEVDAAWMKELENASAKFHINRLDALKLHVRQQVEVMLGGMSEDVQSVLQEVYTDTFYHACYELQKCVGIGFDVSRLDDKKVAEILSKPWAADGSDFSDKVWRNKRQLVYALEQELSRMVLTGESPKKAIAGIRKACGASNYQAKRLVMTEQAYFTSKAQEKAFNELDVERYEVLSSMDKDVCKLCGEMDKKVFAMQDFHVGVTAPPFHPFCRCVTAPYFDDEFAGGKRFARDAKGEAVYIDNSITYEEWKRTFAEEKSNMTPSTTPDIKFATKQGATITAKQKFNDTITVSSAYNALPIKVKQNFNDVTFEFGYDGSACDIWNRTIRVGMGATKEEVFHEVGHLIENYIMHSADVRKYKEYLVDGLTYSDIIIETYYDTVGNGVDIFLLNGSRFESEYQSRLYISNITEALNPDGTIKVDVLGEVISEVFRKYMNGENISDEAKKLIEGAVL